MYRHSWCSSSFRAEPRMPTSGMSSGAVSPNCTAWMAATTASLSTTTSGASHRSTRPAIPHGPSSLPPPDSLRKSIWRVAAVPGAVRGSLHTTAASIHSATFCPTGRPVQPCTELSGAGSTWPAASTRPADVWSGKYSADRAGRPVIFDPATYSGDRQIDLAMTELFGGFDARFYGAYRDAWPLEPGYEERRELHHLYRLINHLNHFGAGYAPSVERIIRRF